MRREWKRKKERKTGGIERNTKKQGWTEIKRTDKRKQDAQERFKKIDGNKK